MINVNFGSAGADFNEASFGFQALIGANFKVTFEEGENEGDLDVARFYTKKNDFVELKGQINLDEPEDQQTPSLLGNVDSLTGYRVVSNGKVAFQISGLDLGADQLSSFKALSNYLAKQDYKITGNDAANDLYSGQGNDELNGLAGNDFLFSGNGDDKLEGGRGNDKFDAGEGEDTIADKIGADTLIFHKGDGADTVSGFNLLGKAHDTIDLSEFYSGDKDLRFRDLDISRHGKSDIMIDFGGDDEIVLKGVNIKHVDAGDFQF